MRIVLPVHHYPPRYTAGAELYTHRLARWLIAQGHTVEVVCVEQIDAGSPGTITATRDVYQGVPVHRLALNLAAAPPRWAYSNPLIARWFGAYLDQFRPDVVHQQGGYLITASVLDEARQRGIATVITLHDYWYLCPQITLRRGDGTVCPAVPNDPGECAWCLRLASRRFRWADRATGQLAGRALRRVGFAAEQQHMAERRAYLLARLRSADAVIAPSPFVRDLFAGLLDPARLHLNTHSLDLAQFAGVRPPADDGVLRIGYIGQIAQHKGVHLLIEAFRKLETSGRRSELHLYGDLAAAPDYARHLRQLAGGDERIFFHGRFANQQAAAILAGMSLLVVPSNWYEVGPLTILEAFAVGTPVVAAAIGNMATLVRHEVDGLHFASGSAQELGRQLQRVLAEPALLPRLRSGVRPPKDVADEGRAIVALYERALAHPNAAAPAVLADAGAAQRN